MMASDRASRLGTTIVVSKPPFEEGSVGLSKLPLPSNRLPSEIAGRPKKLGNVTYPPSTAKHLKHM